MTVMPILAKNKWRTLFWHAVVAVALSILSTSCSRSEFPSRGGGDNGRDNNDASLDNDGILTKRELSKISILELDEPDFRIYGLRVGLQDYMRSQSPTITYTLPEKADYVEILRCKSDTIIRGTFDNLQDVDLGSSSLGEEAKIFQENNFWAAAQSQQNNCLLLSTTFSGKTFVDNVADSGSYRYLMRACVSSDRLADVEYGTARNCTRFVGLSQLLSGYVNRRVVIEREAWQRSHDLQNKVDGLGREIYYSTVAMNNALVECQDAEANRQARVKRKAAITQILGIGVSLGMQILLPETSLTAVNAGQKTWGQLWGEMWQNRDQIAGNGLQIGTVLGWLFSSPNDYPKSCTKAKEIAMRAQIKLTDLQNSHKEWAQAMDEAEAARKARTEIGR